jgi:polyhydroxyalkanoate synthesis repressor PhaR
LSDTPPAGEAKSARAKGAGDEKVVIKKYANRRLYNTASSSYVTLEHLREMVKEGVDFVVYDAKTNDDITRSVLGQIIFDEEGKGGQNLLPIQFLRQLIGFYGNQMQSFLPSYLEASLDAFTKQQEHLRRQMTETFGAAPGSYGPFDEQVRQNLALFDRAMKMFSPFAYAQPQPPSAAAPAASPAPEPAAAAPEPERQNSIADLKAQMEEMQRQIEKLAGGR